LVWVKPLQVRGNLSAVTITSQNESGYGKKRIFGHG
jgi:hypothetical protein